MCRLHQGDTDMTTLRVTLLSRTEQRKAERQQTQAIQQQVKEVDAHVGRTAVEQLAWIVGLSQRTLGYGEALDTWSWIIFFAVPAFKYLLLTSRIPTEPGRSQKVVAEVQDALSTIKTLICGLADGRVVNLSPETGDLTFNIRRDAKGRLSREYRGPLSTQVFLRTLDLLEEAGCDRLRRCPYHAEGQPVCGRVFVKRKGQRFCSPDHAQAAAYAAWVKRGMPRGTKERRKTK